MKAKQVPSLPGLEPGTFELEVQCANPLRHRDLVLELNHTWREVGLLQNIYLIH